MKVKERESGFELLKILAIFLIVVSHVVHTLVSGHPELGQWNYNAFLDITGGTRDLQQLCLVFLRGMGALGNAVFFACSAYFLVDSRGCSGKKMLQIMVDIWYVSLLILAVLLLCGVRIAGKTILTCFLPIFFEGNWYMTAYLLFYGIHGWLNTVLQKMDQPQLLKSTLILIFLYYVTGTFLRDHYFANPIFIFLTIYFLVAYMKAYLPQLSASRRFNGILLISCILLQVLLILCCNFLNLHGIPVSMLMWNSNQNIINLLGAVALLNLFRSLHFQSHSVNRFAGLSMLIYLIHENLLVRVYLRPRVFEWIYGRFGYDRILLWVLLYASLLLLVSAGLAWLYQLTFQRLSRCIVSKLYDPAVRLQNRVLGRLMKIR